MTKKLKEDDAIEIKDRKDMSAKDQKDIKDAPVDESKDLDDDKKGMAVIATEDDNDADDKKTVVKEKKSVKESTDHIVGIVSSGKLNLLEDGIMKVINSKLVEKLDAAKEQVKAKAAFKGA